MLSLQFLTAPKIVPTRRSSASKWDYFEIGSWLMRIV
jgi:hypothetical protein